VLPPLLEDELDEPPGEVAPPEVELEDDPPELPPPD
jgi:hypothetical protein